VESNEAPVSHVDLYHKLGRMEALLETMMASISTFQGTVKDIHARIDAIEARQNKIENSTSSSRGATSALTGLAKDFAIPLLAVSLTWLIAREQVKDSHPKPPPLPVPHHSGTTGSIGPSRIL
jgi:hypothetical protein